MSLEAGLATPGLLILIIALADAWAIRRTVDSTVSIGTKVLWSVLILVLPVLGLILWAIDGPKNRSN